ncbi:transcription antitermination factor NusB [Flaviflexus massiliensis]|uniref:transcription antitermination factor NusB n=1 Tax=Flaviflexus massiliensis TaxID=1522309 RepID=UPI0006D5849A|nr:transcription antitermination factor NusB [Flaviflexus massiliensis]
MSEDRPTNWRPARMQSDPARVVALDVLEQVRNGAYANIALPATLRRANVRGRGRGFATNLTYGTLRMQGRWDAIIANCVQGRPVDEIDPLVMDILRLGAHQILGLRVPIHAAMNETVNLARNEVGSGASGFVNAVMHRISERTNEEWDELIAEELKDQGERAVLAAQTSHPEWILEVYEDSFDASGRDREDLPKLLAANNEPARVALAPRAVSRETVMSDAAEAGVQVVDGVLVPDALVLEKGNPGRMASVRELSAGVQDEGSQLVAHLLAVAPLEGRDEEWLDLCAGPGGKTATLASLTGDRDVTIFANELHPHRLDLVADAVAPFGDIVVMREGDGRELADEEPGRFDRALVDVPCSAIGSLRRRPEARWRKDDGDAEGMTELQAGLLEAAINATREGGIICYSTCSPDLRETKQIVDRFVDRVEVLDTVELASSMVLPGKLDGMTGPYLQLWPDLHESDAMFAALLVKK